VGVDRRSRFAAKYEAKKKMSRIFGDLYGLNENGPMKIHSRAPLTVVPTPGSKRRDQERDGRHEGQIAIAIEVTYVANELEGDGETQRADDEPECLISAYFGSQRAIST